MNKVKKSKAGLFGHIIRNQRYELMPDYKRKPEDTRKHG